VIDFRVDPAEQCYPIVPAGASNDDIVVDTRVAPRAEERSGEDVVVGGVRA
jgi:hypothetical protein